VSSAIQEAALQTTSADDPGEDLRRDEVLCRLLNTPYQPARRPSTSPDPAAMPAPDPIND
jgi:hypothetical protein